MPVPFSPVPIIPVPIIVALWRGNLDKVLETVNPFPEGISHPARRQFRPSRPTGRPRAVPPPSSRSAAPAFLPPSPLPPAAAIPCVWTAHWRQMRRAGLPRPGPRPDPPGTSTVLGAVQAAPECPWVRFASRSAWARMVPSQALADLAKPFAKVNLSRNILILVSNKKCPDLDACLEPPICHIGRHPDSPETRHA